MRSSGSLLTLGVDGGGGGLHGAGAAVRQRELGHRVKSEHLGVVIRLEDRGQGRMSPCERMDVVRWMWHARARACIQTVEARQTSRQAGRQADSHARADGRTDARKRTVTAAVKVLDPPALMAPPLAQVTTPSTRVPVEPMGLELEEE